MSWKGELPGAQLRLLPTPIVLFGVFADRYPEGEVLSRDVRGGFYGGNPYAYYDTVSRPLLFDGELDERFPAMERVVGVVVDGENMACPFSVLEDVRVANDELGGVPIIAMWGTPETVSAPNAPTIVDSDPVGSGVTYERTLDRRVLTFGAESDDLFRDVESGSTWNILEGDRRTDGWRGTDPGRATNHFWFAWAAFNSDSPVWNGRVGSIDTPS